MTNLGPDEILDCNTSFERSLSKLSENYKIFDIGSTILKFKAVERCSTTLRSFNGLGILSDAIT